MDATACAKCGFDFSLMGDHFGEKTTVAEQGDSERDDFDGRQSVAHFRLLKQLGQGAFGSVWQAEDTRLERRVAIKLPKPRRSNDVLLHEAKTAAKIKHPHIVAIYEVGEDAQQVYIASEFIDGEDLRDELNRGRPAQDRVLDVVATIADAVHHAHQLGIIHRDLKPANVIVDQKGVPYVTDFGIAKQLDTNETISSDGAIVGTISYMSPEQAKGQTRETDHRSDVYSLGVMLFEMLTEYRPFRGNAQAILQQKIFEPAPSPRKLVPSLDRDLETICLKCLEADPAKRYQSAEAFAAEIRRYQNGEPILARPIGRIRKSWRWCRRKPGVAGLLAGVVLSLSLGLLSTSYFWRQASQRAHDAREALYRNHMSSAAVLWRRGDVRSLRQRLVASRPGGELSEFRDFSCRYYERLNKAYRQIVNHGEIVTGVAVSSDGSLFAAAGADRVISVWSSDDGQRIRKITTRAGAIKTIAFIPRTKRLATAHASGDIKIWNPVQNDDVLHVLGHGNGLETFACSKDGERLLSAGRGGIAKLWLVEKLSSEEIEVGPKPILNAAFADDGESVALVCGRPIGGDGEVQLLDLEALTIDKRFPARGALCATFESPGSVAIGTYGGRLNFVDLESGDSSGINLGTGPIGSVDRLAGTRHLAIASMNSALSILKDRQLSNHLYGAGFNYGLLSHSQSARSSALVTSAGDGMVSLLDADQLELGDVYWRPLQARAVEFISDRELAIGDGQGAVHLLDTQTMESHEVVAANEREILAITHSSPRGLMAIGGMQRELTLIDPRKADVPIRVPFDFAGLAALSFSPGGDQIVVGGRNGFAYSVQTTAPESPSLTFARERARINDIACHPKETLFAFASANERVEIYRPDQSNASVHTIQLPAIPVCVVFCHDGDRLAVGLQDGRIELYDSGTWQQVHSIDAHAGRVNSLSVFPNGEQIVSAGRDRLVAIWDVDSGENVTHLHGHRRQVFDVCVAPDGNTIASSGLSGDVIVWRAD